MGAISEQLARETREAKKAVLDARSRLDYAIRNLPEQEEVAVALKRYRTLMKLGALVTTTKEKVNR